MLHGVGRSRGHHGGRIELGMATDTGHDGGDGSPVRFARGADPPRMEQGIEPGLLAAAIVGSLAVAEQRRSERQAGLGIPPIDPFRPADHRHGRSRRHRRAGERGQLLGGKPKHRRIGNARDPHPLGAGRQRQHGALERSDGDGMVLGIVGRKWGSGGADADPIPTEELDGGPTIRSRVW